MKKSKRLKKGMTVYHPQMSEELERCECCRQALYRTYTPRVDKYVVVLDRGEFVTVRQGKGCNSIYTDIRWTDLRFTPKDAKITAIEMARKASHRCKERWEEIRETL